MDNLLDLVDVSINHLEQFKYHLEASINLVTQMTPDDTIEAVHRWNAFSGKLQELVFRAAEKAEIDAIEAIALDLEELQSIGGLSSSPPINTDVPSVIGNSDANIVAADKVLVTVCDNDKDDEQSADSECSVILHKPEGLYINNDNKQDINSSKSVVNDNNEQNDKGDSRAVNNDNKVEENNKGTNSVMKLYTCPEPECIAQFITKGNLIRHAHTHTGTKPWECNVCHNRFTEKKSLKVHMRKHTGERPFRCTYCDKSFTQSGILTSHLAVHTNSKSFICDICNRAFRQKSQLKLHVQRHAGVRRFSCSECGFKFLTKGDLLRHQRTHTGERPFCCKLCGRTYTRQQSLKEHINRHNGQNPYTCKYCFKAFPEMSACYKHIKSHKITENNAKESTINMNEFSSLIENNNSNLNSNLKGDLTLLMDIVQNENKNE